MPALPLHRLHADDDALADGGVLQAAAMRDTDPSDPFPLPQAVRVQ
jgi:hypothetical protein